METITTPVQERYHDVFVQELQKAMRESMSAEDYDRVLTLARARAGGAALAAQIAKRKEDASNAEAIAALAGNNSGLANLSDEALVFVHRTLQAAL